MSAGSPAQRSAARAGAATMLVVLCDLARFARPYPWALPSLVLLGLMASLAEGFGIGLLIPLLDILLGGASGVAPGSSRCR